MFDNSKIFLDNSKLYLDAWLHNFSIKKKILVLEKNNKIINNNKMLFLVNKINLKYLLKINNYNRVYKLGDLIFYDEYKTNVKLSISPIIFNVFLNDNLKIKKTSDITSTFKKYTMNVPIFIIIKLEKLNICDTIEIVLLKNSKMVTIKYILEDILYKKIFEII